MTTQTHSDSEILLLLDADLSEELPCGVVSWICDMPATHRIVQSCGCSGLVCDQHAERARTLIEEAKMGIAWITCRICGADPVACTTLERFKL